MKKIFSLILAAMIATSAVLYAGASLLSPGLLVLSENDPMVMSGLCGEPVAFSGADFCRHTGLDSYKKITITSLPSEDEGMLTVGGKEVSENDSISFSDTDRLVFSPAEGIKESSFTFTVGDGCETRCTVILTDKINLEPTATSTLSAIRTYSGMSASGHMVASDPDGDKLSYDIIRYPAKGTVDFDKATGEFTYSATGNGEDSFTFIVKDTFGNYSEEATVNFAVSVNSTGISFTDMTENGAYAAAIHMIDEGVMQSREADGEVYFDPAENVSRLDFLVSAMNILGASNLPEISDSGFADDKDIPLDCKSYVYSAYKLGIINGSNIDGQKYFRPDDPITCFEAAVILNNIVGYEASSDYSFSENVPVWAKDSVTAMYELGILSSYNSSDDKLTKDTSAKLLSGLVSLIK